MELVLLVAAGLALGFVNGANDNGKGVATLVGAGRLAPRPAILYATITTLCGSLAALVLGRALLARFSGEGLIAPELVGALPTALVVAGAAGATVLVATRLGQPISTTHALVGGLVGVGLASQTLRPAALAGAFVAPLVLGPLLAFAGTVGSYPGLRRLRSRLGVTHDTCVCVVTETGPLALPAGISGLDGGAAAGGLATGRAALLVDGADRCAGYRGTIAGISAQRLLDAAHLLTGGAVGFARGLNDTPKIAALLLVTGAAGEAPQRALLVTALAIAAGGLAMAKRVTDTMSYRITPMNDGQAFTANLTTAGLVILASTAGLPVSTTHVSCGALFGIGAVEGRARWRTIATILTAWVATLPAAAALAAAIWLVLVI